MILQRFRATDQQTERAYILRYKRGRYRNVDGKAVFVSDNPGAGEALVHVCAAILREQAEKVARLGWHDLTVEELLQEGALGVLDAAERFDLERNNRFSTYAAFWIRHRMQRAAMQKGSNVPAPVGAHRETAKVNREGLDDTDRTQAVRSTRREVRIDHLRRWGSSDEVIDLDPDEILDHDCETPEELAAQSDERRKRAALVREAMQRLSPEERIVIQRRYFWEEQQTLRDIGNLFGLSRERARQIEVRALDKLEAALTRLILRQDPEYRRETRELLLSA